MLSLFAAAASFTAPPSMVGQNVQLRRSAAPQMAVVFKAGDTVQMITGDSKGAPACMAEAGVGWRARTHLPVGRGLQRLEAAPTSELAPPSAAATPQELAESALRLARVTAFAPMRLHGAPSCAALSGARPFAAPKHRLRAACSGRHAASLSAPQHHDLCHHLSDPPLLTRAAPFRRAGESGKVIAVDKKGGKLTIEGINMQTKHVKPMKGARLPRPPHTDPTTAHKPTRLLLSRTHGM